MDFLPSLFRIYFNDKDALDFIHEKVTFSQVFFIGWFLTILISFISSFTPQPTEVIDILNTYGLSIFLVNLISSIIIYPIVVFIFYGIVHVLLHLSGGKAKYLETLKFMVALSIVPLIFNSFLSLLSFIPLYDTLFSPISTAIISFGMLLWALFLFTQILSVIHQISTLKTFFVGILLLLIFLIIFFTIIVFVSVAIMFQATSSLQANSLDVGGNIQEKITTDIEVVQVYAADTSDGLINMNDNITIITRLGFGSSSVNLNDLIIKLDTQSGSQTLQYTTGPASTSTYNVSYVSNGGIPGTKGYLVTGDLAQISFSTLNELSETGSASIRLLTKDGSVKPVDLVIPSNMTEITTYIYP